MASAAQSCEAKVFNPGSPTSVFVPVWGNTVLLIGSVEACSHPYRRSKMALKLRSVTLDWQGGKLAEGMVSKYGEMPLYLL